MQYKKVGRTGLKISEITLGTMIFGQQVGDDVV
jgi:aryl-alcohol dehydrogenase-like predicted oxidoreductase